MNLDYVLNEHRLSDLSIGDWLWLPATRPDRYRQALFCGLTPRNKLIIRLWHEARDCRSDAHLGAAVSIWPQFPIRKCSYRPILEDVRDGARVFLDNQGAFYERQGDRWIRST